MMKYILIVFLTLCTEQQSLASQEALLDELKGGIRQRSLGSSQIKQTPASIKKDQNLEEADTQPEFKNWRKIENDLILHIAELKNNYKASLRLDLIIGNLKNIAQNLKDFKKFVYCDYGFFEDDQLECLRKRCLLYKEWENKNSCTLFDLEKTNKKAYGEAIVEILNTPIADAPSN